MEKVTGGVKDGRGWPMKERKEEGTICSVCLCNISGTNPGDGCGGMGHHFIVALICFVLIKLLMHQFVVCQPLYIYIYIYIYVYIYIYIN